jgi:hypothetical protein
MPGWKRRLLLIKSIITYSPAEHCKNNVNRLVSETGYLPPVDFDAAFPFFRGLPGRLPVALRKRYHAACRDSPSLSISARISGSCGFPCFRGPASISAIISLALRTLSSGCFIRLRNAVVRSDSFGLFVVAAVFFFSFTVFHPPFTNFPALSN